MGASISNTENKSLCVILPILNEAEHIAILLEGIKKELSSFPFLVVIIDDGSTDGTIELVNKFESSNPGKIKLIQRIKKIYGCQRGNALLAGMLWALENTSHNIFVEIDGDLSHRTEELPTGIKICGTEADIVISSKYMDGSKILNRPPGRRFVSLFITGIMRILLGSGITDYSNGYRFYTRKAAELLSRYNIRYGSPIYLSEAMAIWLSEKLKVKEFPGTYIGRNQGLSKVRINDLLKAGIAIFDIFIRYRITGFSKK